MYTLNKMFKLNLTIITKQV